ncbi:MAG: fatty acid desaturase [Caldilineaceae bacterium]|nr:fatty acid desaturase [Caldilineaceae bacterium]MDE0430885.1 fatty acid desaturase [Caldilineaceae bacterium]
MTYGPVQSKINWYRSPIDRTTLAELNQRSDLLGLAQTLGHLGLLALTGAAAWFAVRAELWWALVPVLFLHGTFYAFLLNGFHELCHRSVFRSKFLNEFFLRVFSFLGWYNHVHFWTSHQEHHKYTLHPPDDLEVVLPVEITLNSFLKAAVVNPWGLFQRVKGVVRLSFGQLEGEWENMLFPPDAEERRSRLFNWARILLAGHLLLTVVSLALSYLLALDLWLLPVLVTLAPFYGGWLLFLCNNTQHVGLMDNIPDYRLCTRTIILNPFVRFLYWHMNFHIEHHMYAAVPCYKLGRLHKAIKADLPPSPVGLAASWKEIIAILEKQKEDPSYQHLPEAPNPVLA